MKKTISLILSLVICCATATSIVSSAIETFPLDVNSDEYNEIMYGFTEINDSGLFESLEWPDNPNPNPYKIYTNDVGGYIYEETIANGFYFTVKKSDDVSAMENIIRSILNKYDPSYDASYTQDENQNYAWTVMDYELNSDTVKNARFIYEELKAEELITDFYYAGDMRSPTYFTCPYLTAYSVTYIDSLILQEYISNNDLDCEITLIERENSDFWGIASWSDAYCVIPNYEISIEEHFALAKQIEDATGFSPLWISPTTTDIPCFANNFDLYNAKYGDVDGSGKLDALDASEILTYYAAVQTGKSASYTEEEKDLFALVGDYDGDGAVNAMDASDVLTVYAKEQTS